MPGPLVRRKGGYYYRRSGRRHRGRWTKWSKSRDYRRGGRVGYGRYRHTHDRGRHYRHGMYRKGRKKWGRVGSPHSAKRRRHLARIRRR